MAQQLQNFFSDPALAVAVLATLAWIVLYFRLTRRYLSQSTFFSRIATAAALVISIAAIFILVYRYTGRVF